MKNVNQLLLITGLLCLFQQLQAFTWQVSKQGSLVSIQLAIRQAKANDTIVVESGLYLEKNMVIDKPLVLIGKNKPVLDGEELYEIISIRSNGVVIDGFQLVRSGYSDLTEMAAVKIYNASRVTIRNNFFDDTRFGIYSQHSKNCIILNNRFQASGMDEMQSGNGIHCWRSDSMTITGNFISGHRDGIYFEFVTNSSIINNQSLRNIRYGLHFMFSHNNRFDRNIFSDNGSGCAVMFSHDVVMTGNTFSKHTGSSSYGILMKEISDSFVQGNTFNHNTSGIYMEGTNRIEVLGNDFSRNGTAMRMQASCSGNMIKGNNFLSNTFDVATNGSLMLNTLTGNYWDKYQGYDLDRNGVGDVPFHPINLYSMLTEQVPEAMMLLHSFMVTLMDNVERMIPTITPENFRDDQPVMKVLAI